MVSSSFIKPYPPVIPKMTSKTPHPSTHEPKYHHFNCLYRTIVFLTATNDVTPLVSSRPPPSNYQNILSKSINAFIIINSRMTNGRQSYAKYLPVRPGQSVRAPWSTTPHCCYSTQAPHISPQRTINRRAGGDCLKDASAGGRRTPLTVSAVKRRPLVLRTHN